MLDPKHRLFRKEALARLSSPERLDQLMPVVGRRGWLPLLAIGLLFAAGLLWAFLGSIPTNVNGQGWLVRAGAVVDLQSPASGRLTELKVRSGDLVKKGDVLGTIVRAEEVSRIECAHTGRILETTAAVGQLVARGDRLGSMEVEAADAPLVGLIYFPIGSGRRIGPGTPIQITPETAGRDQYGGFAGRVASISTYPVTKERVVALVGNVETAGRLLEKGPQLEAIVELDPHPATSAGEARAATFGLPQRLVPGIPLTARARVDERPPISYLLPDGKVKF